MQGPIRFMRQRHEVFSASITIAFLVLMSICFSSVLVHTRLAFSNSMNTILCQSSIAYKHIDKLVLHASLESRRSSTICTT